MFKYKEDDNLENRAIGRTDRRTGKQTMRERREGKEGSEQKDHLVLEIELFASVLSSLQKSTYYPTSSACAQCLFASFVSMCHSNYCRSAHITLRLLHICVSSTLSSLSLFKGILLPKQRQNKANQMKKKAFSILTTDVAFPRITNHKISSSLIFFPGYGILGTPHVGEYHKIELNPLQRRIGKAKQSPAWLRFC